MVISMKTTKITSGYAMGWVSRQIKDFNRSTGLGIKPIDSVNRAYDLSNAYTDSGIMKYSHNNGITIDNDRFVLNVNDNGTTTISSKGKGQVGFSKCHKNDAYNYWFGIAIAWARYKHEDLPEFSVNIKDLKIGDRFKHNDSTYELLAVNPYTKRTAKYYCVLVATNKKQGWAVGDVICLDGSHKVIISNV
jgi:hypothetical protein